MIWNFIILVCLALVSATMVVRANDLRKNGNEQLRPAAFHLRLIGFTLVAAMPVGIIGMRMGSESSLVFEAFFTMGLLAVFVTTPNHLPWWRWMSRGE